MKKILLPFSIILIFCAYFFSSAFFSSNHSDEIVGYFPINTPNEKFGFCLDTFNVHTDEIKKNQFLADILLQHHVNYNKIDALAHSVDSIFDIRGLRSEKDYYILSKDTSEMADYFVYNPGPYFYVVYDLKNPEKSRKIKRESEYNTINGSGVIESNMWNTISKNNFHQDIAIRLEDAFAWSVDFYHLQKGDSFKVLFDEEYIQDELVGVGQLYAASFTHYGVENYVFRYKNGKIDGYYDKEGRPIKKAFLRSPVKFSRLSSRFNLTRKHPVLKYVRAHKGTDYAAPRNTPIMATADGVVVKRGYTKGKGNFVQIKHDKTYQTAYYHMNKFEPTVKKGSFVKQGNVIGYVGSTGLSTGNHVCYRFWKNGKQVDPLREKFAKSTNEPMPKEFLEDFMMYKDSLLNILEN